MSSARPSSTLGRILRSASFRLTLFYAALFIASAAVAYWRLTGRVLVTRLAIMVVTIALLPLVASMPPIGPLTVVAIGLLTIVLLEELRPVGANTAKASLGSTETTG